MDEQQDLGQGTSDEVIGALNDEIKIFTKREKLLSAQQVR